MSSFVPLWFYETVNPNVSDLPKIIRELVGLGLRSVELIRMICFANFDNMPKYEAHMPKLT